MNIAIFSFSMHSSLARAVLLGMFNVSIILLLIALSIRNYIKLGYKICPSSVFMMGRVVLVTGANSGIGFRIAMDLAARGARVILGCRNESRGLSARDAIISETGNPNVVFRKLDLSSVASVVEFANGILETEERLDVLINNAGIHGLGDKYTNDNILESMQVNHFGPFLLTNLLLPLLCKSAPSRIVIVSSILHYFGEMKPEKLNEKNNYNDFQKYANAKLCNVLFTMELARRLKGTQVVANAVHPGVTATNISARADRITRALFDSWCWLCCRTVQESVQTLIYLSSAKEAASVSGEYFVDCEPARTLKDARDPKLAAELWKLSEELVGCKFMIPSS